MQLRLCNIEIRIKVITKTWNPNPKEIDQKPEFEAVQIKFLIKTFMWKIRKS